jgi:TonB family protein
MSAEQLNEHQSSRTLSLVTHALSIESWAVGLRPMIASLLLHLALLLAIFAGGPLFDDSFTRLDIGGDPIEVVLVSSPTAGAAAPIRSVKVRTRTQPEKKSNIATNAIEATGVIEATGAIEANDTPHLTEKVVDPPPQAGNSAKLAVAGLGESNSPEAQYLSEIRTMLDSKKEYPIAARRMGHRGRVVVRFVLERDGRVQKAEILQSSASEILNRAARGLIEGLRTIKPFPKEVALSEWAVVVPIEYQM